MEQQTPPLVRCRLCGHTIIAEAALWEATEHSTYDAQGRPQEIEPTCTDCYDEIRSLDRAMQETGE